jgi:hypothetical protein
MHRFIIMFSCFIGVTSFAAFDQRLVGSWDLGCYSDNTREIIRFKATGKALQDSYVYEKADCKGKLLNINHVDGGVLTTSDSTAESVVVDMVGWKDLWSFIGKYSAEVKTLKMKDGSYQEVIDGSSPRIINRY